jgi:ferric-dicitrate binding protein FerR (iron transport regulator)
MSGRNILRLVTAVVLLVGVEALGAGRQDNPRVLGFLAARGDVRVDQQSAPSGTALFAGDVITTGRASVAVMNFHSGTVATVSEGGEVAISRDLIAPPGLSLTQGAMAIRSAGNQGIQIAVPGASVVVKGAAGYPALCRVAVVGGTAGIFADRGRVEVHGRGAPILLAPGKSLRLAAGRPQAAGQHAGKVSNAIPQEVVQPQGKGAEIPLQVADGVNWEDVVKTLKTGRVRIMLEDGSTLNIGARSVMRITKHDAQSQQTQVELQLGRLRGEVVKITKPGGSFQVKTNTAVIGVVGTIFTVQAQRSVSRVSCMDGTVSVENVNPAIAGQVTLQAGQSTSVPINGPPSNPVPTGATQAVNEISQTAAGEPLSGEMTHALQALGASPAQVNAAAAGAQGAAQAGAAGGPVTGAVGNLTPTVANGVVTGTGAVSAALGGVAISRAADARDTANAAESALSNAAETNRQAADAAQQAADAAQNAADTATQVSDGVQDVIDVLSPSAPGCGCVP